MIAAWMLYCTLCAAALAAASLLGERALLGAGGSVRHVWIAAIVLSLAIPAAAYRAALRPMVPVAVPVRSPSVLVESALGRAVTTRTVENPRVTGSNRNWREMMRAITRANRFFVAAWVALSAALALYFLVGVIALARMRRRWQPQNVMGFSVWVSEATGPAVVGAVSPAIVMPAWALSMEPSQLALMLRHEEEHRRAKDAQLMTAAQLVLIVMPWNIALWWLTVRLGMAVELDCDSRVLRNADARSYGDLLLEVARPRRGPRLIGATAFAERADQLERRIRAITRRRDRASRGARAVAALTGFAVVSIAWVAPRPSVPPRVALSKHEAPIATSSDTETNPVSAIDSVHSPAEVANAGTDVPLRAEIPPLRVATTKPVGGFALVPSPAELPVPSVRTSPLVDSVIARLFAGIPLSPEQLARAQDIMVKLELRQMVQDVSAITTVLHAEPIATSLQTQQDSALRALLTNDADRALLDSHLAVRDSGIPVGGGRRGRSGGGAPPDANAVGGGRGGGRGRAGGPTFAANVQLSIPSTEEVYRRLFDGITLTAEQEANARSIIDATLEKFLALIPELPMTELRLVNPGRVAMRAESRDMLAELLTNDADQSLLVSRTAVETRTVIKRGMSMPPR